jgi:cytochrome c
MISAANHRKEPMMKIACAWLTAITLATTGLSASAAGDAARGARVFQQCAACHSVQAGQHMTGPSLANVFGRKAASVPGFERYSDALRHSNIVWAPQALDKWIANPQAMVPGTAMTFAGIRDGSARADLVAYLKAVSEGKAPAPGSVGGGGMMGGMMGAAEPDDMRKAGPDSQVASIRHCRDTYTVRTRDGKTHRIWEYNLRIKTDSSERGPGGTPVIVGSGMRGDRFSIVFATPKDISRLIEERCEQQ